MSASRAESALTGVFVVGRLATPWKARSREMGCVRRMVGRLSGLCERSVGVAKVKW